MTPSFNRLPKRALLSLMAAGSMITTAVAAALPTPVASWRFEAGPAGTDVPVVIGTADAIIDISGNGNHLRTWASWTAPTYVSDVPSATVPQTGEANTLSLSFTPNQDVYTEGKPINTLQFTEWTLEASFKTNEIGTAQSIVIKDGNPTWGPPPISLRLTDFFGHLELGLVDGAGQWWSLETASPLEANTWYSVAATGTATEMRLYLKGPQDAEYVLQGTASISGAFFNSYEGLDRAWVVGRGIGGDMLTEWFDGVIDEVRISDSALAPSEFLQVSGSNPAAASTVAHWNFEEGEVGASVPPPTTDSIEDSSGNGNHMRTYADFTAPTYVEDVPFQSIPQTGAANNLALSFTPNQDLYTQEKTLNSHPFSEWTLEASFKANVVNAWQVIVGKDGRPLLPGEPEGGALHGAPPIFFKTLEFNSHLEVGLVDGAREFHTVSTLSPLQAGEWYSVAATGTATEMSLWLKGPGDSDYVLQGTVAISGAFVSPSDFNNPNDYNWSWTVGRGMWAGGIADWFNGVVDEVRIYDVALDPSQFLAAGDAVVFDPNDLEVRAVIVERMENGVPQYYLGLETWDVADGTLQLEASADLVTWQDTPFTREVVEPTGGSRDRLRLTSNILVDEHNRHFLRARVDR